MHRSLADAVPAAYWLDNGSRPAPRPPLAGAASADLTVVGGGYTGLWTALLAKQRDPTRDVLLLEGQRIGWAASGRNGGFCDASLTHGLSNGVDRFAAEIEHLEELGLANLDAIERTVHEHGIDCDFRRTGGLEVATAPHQTQALVDEALLCASFGQQADLLDRDQVYAELHSPTLLSGLWRHGRTAIVDPARLAWGLADACEAAGVQLSEATPVTSLERSTAGVALSTPGGLVRSATVALATNAFDPLLRRIRHRVLPVWDYALMSEPLDPSQLDAIGWGNRQGLSDCGNQFHYSRLTSDNRILWGGYDAIYHYGNRTDEALAQRPVTASLLARQFFEMFPQLEGLRFTHSWGGIIDTSSRFSVFFGTAMKGRVAYAAGYTGLGVGASRFGGAVLLDLLDPGGGTGLGQLELVRRRPVPFPPEPLRWMVVEATRRSLARADRNGGRENLWLRTLSRLGLGFDS